MLSPRVIPCLLIHDGGLVKTVKFDDPKYVGDPINAVRIFNEKQVDELIVVDIDATANGTEPDYTRIEQLAAECRMPLCYGGGVTAVEQVERIVSLGVEKVAMSNAAIQDLSIVSRAAEVVGSQSVVVVLDVGKGRFGLGQRLYTHNGKNRTNISPADFAAEAEAAGAGELVVNCIEREGTMEGYDLDLLTSIRDRTSVPLTAMGGASSLNDIRELFRTFGIIGAAAGSLFVFKGPFRAVLINYPDRSEKEGLFSVSSTASNSR